MNGPTGNARILQIHPTRLCNLRCLHCYSNSGPEHKGEIPWVDLAQLLMNCADSGYNTLAVSGGEPLLYSHLVETLALAKRYGMRTMLTTNGMLLNGRWLERLAGVIDLIAISLDGTPVSHNAMRGHLRAFDRMAANLPALRASGIPFGFLFTLTQYNIDELQWVANFALDEGASLLQVHPLEATGRALNRLQDGWPDGVERLFAALEVGRIEATLASSLRLQLDLLNRNYVRTHPELVYASECMPTTLAEQVTPLVLEPDGMLVPLAFGFARPYAFGNILQESWDVMLSRWQSARYPQFRRLCHEVFSEVTAESEIFPFFNWYATMAARGASADIGLAVEMVG